MLPATAKSLALPVAADSVKLVGLNRWRLAQRKGGRNPVSDSHRKQVQSAALTPHRLSTLLFLLGHKFNVVAGRWSHEAVAVSIFVKL